MLLDHQCFAQYIVDHTSAPRIAESRTRSG